MKNMTFKITGEAPLLMHSCKLANPLDPLTKEYKKTSRKRLKTDEEQAELQRLEWKSSLYYNKKLGVYIPSEAIDSTLWNAAKKFKLGTAFKQAVLIFNDSKLIFKENSLPPDDLYQIDDFRDVRTVVISRSRIMRCRPIFHDWSFTFDLSFDDQILNTDDIIKIIEAAGKYIGLCDYRPRFGRFSFKQI